MAFIFYMIDPVKLLNRGNDTRRRHDFLQIRTALDSYYNDHNCYPDSIPFGQQWSQDGVVYMRLVPQDPDCTRNQESCYVYVADSTQLCSQWNVLFGKVSVLQKNNQDCALETSCLPINYAALGYNACVFAGSIDCGFLQSYTIPSEETPTPTPISSPTPSDIPTATPTAGPTQPAIPSPTSTLTPTPIFSPPSSPTPTPTINPICDNGYYYCGCGGHNTTVCNVTFTRPAGIQYYCSPSCDNQCGKPC